MHRLALRLRVPEGAGGGRSRGRSRGLTLGGVAGHLGGDWLAVSVGTGPGRARLPLRVRPTLVTLGAGLEADRGAPKARPRVTLGGPSLPCHHLHLPLFLMTRTSPHSSSTGRKISGTTIRILRLGGGEMCQTHSVLAG